MAQEVTITKIDRDALLQLSRVFAQTTGQGSAAGGSSAQQQETRAREGSVRAVREESKARKIAGEGLEKFGKTLSHLGNIIQGQLVRGVLEEFRTGIKSGVEAFSGPGGYIRRQRDAYINLGITVEELHKFNKISRAASINLGGFNKWTAKVSEGQSHYFARIGDLTKAAEYQATMMEQLTHVGTEASDLYGMFGKQLGVINDDLLKLGISYEESRELFQKFAKDEDVRFRLRGTIDKKQRKQILLEIQARIKHFKMLGMSTEQAEKASKALEQLGGKKPLDRFKQAAKAQAALTAMGIEGAADIGNIIRKGNRATEDERKRVAEVFGQAQNIAAEAAQGPMAQEFFVRGLIEKTGLEDMMGKGGVFSHKLDEGATVSQQQLDAMKVLGKHTPILTKSAEYLDKINNAINNNPWLKGSYEVLKNIEEMLGVWGINVGGIAGLLSKGGAIGLAVFGIYEAAKAIMTGTSDIWNWINNFFPNFAKALSNGLGWLADKLVTLLPSWVVGNEAQKDAQYRLDLTERQAKRDEEAAKQRDMQTKIQKSTQQNDMGSLVNNLGPGVSSGGESKNILEEIKRTNSLLAKMTGINEDMASGLGREAATIGNM